MRLWKRRQESRSLQTPYGEFVLRNGYWQGLLETADSDLIVSARDVDGAPDPRLMALLPHIIGHVPELEAAARDAVERLSTEHDLYAITQGTDGADFALDFSYDDEVWSECVFVNFKDGQVTGWGSED